jgi:hypothetical protein
MEPIIRHSAPSKLDQAPFSTECLVFLDGHVWDVYVQYSNDEEDPRWEYMGRKIIEEEHKDER